MDERCAREESREQRRWREGLSTPVRNPWGWDKDTQAVGERGARRNNWRGDVWWPGVLLSWSYEEPQTTPASIVHQNPHSQMCAKWPIENKRRACQVCAANLRTAPWRGILGHVPCFLDIFIGLKYFYKGYINLIVRERVKSLKE